jgi:uncharacterized membrane protein
MGSLAVVVAIAQRIVGIGRRRLGGGAGRTAIGLNVGDTDPGAEQAVAQLAAEVEALRDDVTTLRREMDEAQNRLDFSERLLAQAKDRGLLSPPKER